ncbi:hypothetical protein IAT38_000921 [Cryptococcus sp. DSM 104549]
MSTPEALRDHLLTSLAPLPNAHALGLTVLASTPKRTREIFPHTPHPPKCTQQEWLVVLDSEVPREDGEGAGKPAGDAVADATAPPQRVLVSAISAYLYTFPSSSSALAPSILYISKVDSSGYTPTPLPLTRRLIRSFLLFFLAHTPPAAGGLRVQLFARAQRQYLFANSADGAGKKVLSGAGLCKWWKGVYEETVGEWAGKATGAGGAGVELKYVLPGYEQGEAQALLGPGKPLPEGITWSYAPPFTTPLHPSFSAEPTLATLVPSLPDDPKTRFLEELVGDVPPPPPATTSTTTQAADGAPAEVKAKTKKEKEIEEDEHTRKIAHAALAKVGVDEFWERMGFRQECASGDVTGFFTLEFGVGGVAAGSKGEAEGKTAVDGKEKEGIPQGGGALPVPEGTGDDLNPTLPTLASSASAEVSAPVSALIAGPLPSAPTATNPAPAPTSAPKTALIPPAISSRILTALTNLDFATRALAIEGSGIWLSQTQSIVAGEVGERGWEECKGRIEAKAGGEGVGAVRKEREEAPVTMLQPRKKKKKVA